MYPLRNPTRRSVAALLALAPALGVATGAAAASDGGKQDPRREGGRAARAGQGSQPAVTAQDQQAAIVPGMPDARFFGDLAEPFAAATRGADGPWLTMSGGGSDGAFGAGLLVGMAAARQRPDFNLVAGVSAGALMAPYVFLGPKMDAALRDIYLNLNSSDVFEAAATRDSLFDTWPLARLIGRQVTPELLARVAAEHARGRRLFVVTTNLDAGRSAVWNVGAIAAHGGDQALTLLRQVLLASSSIPGFFPPVRIPVEANGKRWAETHADGTIRAPFYVAPDAVLAGAGAARVSAQPLYVLVNNDPEIDFELTGTSVASVLGRSITATLKESMALELFRVAQAARAQGFALRLARVPADFDVPSRGLFDPRYMRALFERGIRQGQSPTPFGEPVGAEGGADHTAATGAVTATRPPAEGGDGTR